MVESLRTHDPSDPARVRIVPEHTGEPVSSLLFGKFCEHLGRNIDGGMHAQILLNPTFGPWEFPTGDGHPDGGIQPTTDDDRLRVTIEQYCDRWDLPNAPSLAEAHTNGCAFGWIPTGDTRTTPDTSPEGDRAQRVTLDGTGGLQQYTYLPLHRTRSFELSARLRATSEARVTVAVSRFDTGDTLVECPVTVGRAWTTVTDTLTLPAAVEGSDAPFVVSVSASGPIDLVLDRVTLYPDDHRTTADPEIIEYLCEAELPLLRWPGGNFVSGYDWRDGIGPIDERTTRVNPAWGRVESNLFGTSEFIAVCEAIGCEPMICVNAGDGTPEEAADWVEYCNGDTDTEMGALRAEHGHPEPFDVRYWEIGNELFGRWQVRWTNPEGNADRYRRFHEAMTAVDPSIAVQACGTSHSPEGHWNEVLLERAGEQVRCITDHVLTGGSVGAETDSDELFHGSMGYPEQLGQRYRDLRDRMAAAGVDAPRIAITELQLFADFVENPELGHHGTGLSEEDLPTPTTISEALYDALLVFQCARLGETIEMITHSATVNHGGGIQKKRERSWPDPAHHGHALLAPLAETTPLGVDLSCGTISTDRSFGDIEAHDGVPVIDAFASRDEDEGELHLVLVNRHSSDGPTPVTIDLRATGIDIDTNANTETATDAVTVRTLSGASMSEENTYDDPDTVVPETTTVTLENGQLTHALPSYSVSRITIQTPDI